jgi:hypothetical protein
MRAAQRIAHERRSGQCHTKLVGNAWQTELLDRSDFNLAKKNYLESTGMHAEVRSELRSQMEYKHHVAVESRAKMAKLMRIEAALLARAAIVANKRAVAAVAAKNVHVKINKLYADALTADKIAKVAMDEARENGAYA